MVQAVGKSDVPTAIVCQVGDLQPWSEQLRGKSVICELLLFYVLSVAERNVFGRKPDVCFIAFWEFAHCLRVGIGNKALAYNG